MCGILAALGLSGDPEQNRRLILRCSKLLRHRGPDANSIWQSKDGKTFLAFERLQIIDPSDGGRCELVCAPNGMPHPVIEDHVVFQCTLVVAVVSDLLPESDFAVQTALYYPDTQRQHHVATVSVHSDIPSVCLLVQLRHVPLYASCTCPSAYYC